MYLILLLLSMIELCNGYPSGSVYAACSTSIPHHLAAQKTTVSPYTIVTSDSTYSSGQNISINITTTLTGTPGFKGFQIIIQREEGDIEELIGTFVGYSDTLSKGFDWYSSNVNCLTHTSSVEKRDIGLVWTAPALPTGNLIIKTAIAQSYDTFWTDNKLLTATSPTSTAYPSWRATKLNGLNLDVVHGDCGTSKGCMLWPGGCSGSDCEYAITFKTVGEYIDFEMMGTTDGFLSLAISDDDKMGDDETISCIGEGNDVYGIHQGYNPVYYNERIRNSVLRNVRMTWYNNDKRLYCSFTRPIKHVLEMHYQPPNYTSKNRTFDYKGNPMYLAIGWGPLFKGSDAMNKHVKLPLVSPRKVSLQSVDIIHLSSLPVEIQAHGALMMIAWMLLAGCAMVIARHYKDIFSSEWFGIKSWFQLHRGIMVLLFLATAAGFILIFVYLKGFAENSALHAAFGIAVMAITVIQILVAMCRPGPNASKRIYFRWFHRISGFLGHICAAVSIMLGVNLSLMPQRMQEWQTILVAVWIAAHVAWLIIFELIKCWAESTDSDDNVRGTSYNLDQMKGGSQTANYSETKQRPTRIMTITFALYVLTMVVLTAVGLAFIFIF